MKISKTHESGEVLSLQIDPVNLGASVHNKHSCNSCHTEFSRDAHPKKTFKTERDHGIVMSGVCKECHADKASLVKGSVHYNLSFQIADTLIDHGNLRAPVCTDCHGFHNVGPKDSHETISGVPCRKCHEDIFTIYGKSMHGRARAKGEHKALLCSSCHFAHEVGFTAMTDKMKAACLGCHQGAEEAHKKWLPNTELHLRAISCSACHAPEAGKGIYLQAIDRNTGEPTMNPTVVTVRQQLRTPRAAAVAGIIFAVLFIVSVALIRSVLPEELTESSVAAWLGGNTALVSVALTMVPFAGIAFLWFMGVVRAHLGKLEDQFFSSVLVGSGLLFLAMTFASAAIAGGLMTGYAIAPDQLTGSGVLIFGRALMYTIMNVYAVRMAGRVYDLTGYYLASSAGGIARVDIRRT